MKAQELNGTHLGQAISITLAEASLTDVLTEVTHQADLIDDHKMDGAENWVQGRRHTRLRFMRLGSISIDPESVVVLHGHSAPPAAQSGAHFLAENANADPICSCGWDPSRLYVGIDSREEARKTIREHIRAAK